MSFTGFTDSRKSSFTKISSAAAVKHARWRAVFKSSVADLNGDNVVEFEVMLS